MERIAIAMQDGGTGAGAQHGGATSIWDPGGGLFGFKFSSRPHPRKFGQKRFLAVRMSWRGKWGGLFWATSFGKNLSAAARPRERSEPPWPHLAIHAAEHEFPRLHGLPHAQPATEEAGRSMGAGPESF